MNIVGIGGYSHDSAAVLVCDGTLVAGVAEERLTRIKHQGGPPRKAVQYCLDEAGLSTEDVDHICCYMKPIPRIARRMLYRAARFPRNPLYSTAYMGYEIVHNAQYIRDMRGLGGARTQLHYMDHHRAHAASAFLVSPFDEAAILSIDYIGEFTSTWLGQGRATDISSIDTVPYPHSLGVFYSAITDYLGFVRASDEYKVMGLASYGEPEYCDEFANIICEDERHGYKMDLSWMAYHRVPGSTQGYFSKKFIDRFGPPRNRGDEVETRHRNIAASAQKILEDTVLRLAQRLHDATGSRNLCLAGGVALNCAMNGRLLRESPFDQIFVQPAAGDDGIAIGGAYQLHHRLTGAERGFVMRDACIGPAYDDAAILKVLDRAKIVYQTPNSIEQRTAELLADGKIVAWFQGRMEFGPRALGSRSILADPTRDDMKDLVNKYVKHREEFRPFAPACLRERASEFFEGCTHSPFMLFVYPVIKSKQASIPAITHVDGTARVQTVEAQTHPKFYKMIAEFERLRGVPMVLNTSFNVMGEPIAHTPEDALRCFYSTGIDALAIGEHLVVK